MNNPFESEKYKKIKSGFTSELAILSENLKIGECAEVNIKNITYSSVRSLLAKKRFKGQFTTTTDLKGTPWIKRIANP